MAPLARVLPPLTRQSLYLRRLKILGLIRRTELNLPQATWMSKMLHPLKHVFDISTVCVGMPFIGAVGLWLIVIKYLLHCLPAAWTKLNFELITFYLMWWMWDDVTCFWFFYLSCINLYMLIKVKSFIRKNNHLDECHIFHD